MTAATPACSAKADQSTTFSVKWMTGLETAADILGSKVRLADVLAIDPRSLRNKLDAGRGISRGDMLMTAGALDRLAARAIAHADKLRAAVAPPVPPSPTTDEGASA